MSRKIKYGLLAILIVLLLAGGIFKSLVQEAKCWISNITGSDYYGGRTFSTILWSEDNKKLFFITRKYRFYAKVDYRTWSEYFHPFLSFLLGKGTIVKNYEDIEWPVYELYAAKLEKERLTLQQLYEWKGTNSDYTGSKNVYFMDACWLVLREKAWLEGWTVDVKRKEANKTMPSLKITYSKDSLLNHGYSVLVSDSKISLYDNDGSLIWKVAMSDFPRHGIGKAKWKYNNFSTIDGTAFSFSRPGRVKPYYLSKNATAKITISPDKSKIAFYIKDRDNKIYGNKIRLLICIVNIKDSQMQFLELTNLVYRDIPCLLN